MFAVIGGDLAYDNGIDGETSGVPLETTATHMIDRQGA